MGAGEESVPADHGHHRPAALRQPGQHKISTHKKNIRCDGGKYLGELPAVRAAAGAPAAAAAGQAGGRAGDGALARGGVHSQGGPGQYSTVQYSTVQYSTVQYSTVQRWLEGEFIVREGQVSAL